LGTIAFTTGDHETAHHHFYRALEIANDIQYMPVMFLALIGMAELLIADGQQARAVEMLTMIRQHAQCGHEARGRVNQLLSHVPADLHLEMGQDVSERDHALYLDKVIQELLAGGR
jgi:hypothetical protein